MIEKLPARFPTNILAPLALSAAAFGSAAANEAQESADLDARQPASIDLDRAEGTPRELILPSLKEMGLPYGLSEDQPSVSAKSFAAEGTSTDVPVSETKADQPTVKEKVFELVEKNLGKGLIATAMLAITVAFLFRKKGSPKREAQADTTTDKQKDKVRSDRQTKERNDTKVTPSAFPQESSATVSPSQPTLESEGMATTHTLLKAKLASIASPSLQADKPLQSDAATLQVYRQRLLSNISSHIEGGVASLAEPSKKVSSDVSLLQVADLVVDEDAAKARQQKLSDTLKASPWEEWSSEQQAAMKRIVEAAKKRMFDGSVNEDYEGRNVKVRSFHFLSDASDSRTRERLLRNWQVRAELDRVSTSQ